MNNSSRRVALYVFGLTIIVIIGIWAMWFIENNKNKDIKVSTVTSTTSTEIEAVSEGSISKKESESISKKIENIKPTYTLKTSSEVSDSSLISTIKKNSSTKGTTNIIKEDLDTHTTNVYAIDNSKKRKHGIGVYVGKGEFKHEFEYGVSVRSNRTMVLLGGTNKGHHRISVGYEVAQW